MQSGRVIREPSMRMMISFRDQLPGFHHRLRLTPDRRSGGHLGPQHVARADLGNTVTVLRILRLRSLSRARQTQQDQDNAGVLKRRFSTQRPPEATANTVNFLCEP